MGSLGGVLIRFAIGAGDLASWRRFAQALGAGAV